jgi:hypothetical protein
VGIVVASYSEAHFLKRHGALPQNVNFAIKAANLRSLLDTEPTPREPAPDREAAVARAAKSVCVVAVER